MSASIKLREGCPGFFSRRAFRVNQGDALRGYLSFTRARLDPPDPSDTGWYNVGSPIEAVDMSEGSRFTFDRSLLRRAQPVETSERTLDWSRV
jgi:hypothetical protein